MTNEDTASAAREESGVMGTDERARLRALYEAATQTPWRHDGAEITVVGSTLGVDGGETVIAACTLPDCAEVADEDREEQEERNAALMVAAVNALPALLDRVEAAEARVAELEARVAELEARGLALAEDARTAYAQRREMGREAQRLREIIAGRTTLPTDAELTAQIAAVTAERDALALLVTEARRVLHFARAVVAAWDLASSDGPSADAVDAAIHTLADEAGDWTLAGPHTTHDALAKARDDAREERDAMRRERDEARAAAMEECAARCDADAEAEEALGRSDGAWALRFLAKSIRWRAKGGR